MLIGSLIGLIIGCVIIVLAINDCRKFVQEHNSNPLSVLMHGKASFTPQLNVTVVYLVLFSGIGALIGWLVS